ncbi:MAG TPA: pyridoxamine 5'-phosphate oxidase family protein [Bacteroidetes bacterium]|nr:pyridoxamine 5'-phosphate oxidase family protein [Bacteroidota bacterium]
MAKMMSSLNDPLIGFIQKQHMFFVGTAAKGGRVNLSPKGLDSLRVINKNRIAWLNLTGSGNETAAHLLNADRMTLMFCSFEEMPLILRVYGSAKAVYEVDAGWEKLIGLFPPMPGARQVFDMKVESVQTSCGYAVPFYQFAGQRERLNEANGKKGKEGIKEYWKEKNLRSIDGYETGQKWR